MLEAFRLGGWGMFPTLVFGLLAVAASLRYAVRPDTRFVPLLVSSSLLTLAAGSLGFVTGLIASSNYIASAPDHRVWLIGLGESLNNVALALILVGAGLVATTIGALRAVNAPRSA
ncbi:hypothetical protein [Sandaracinus amylolyticus]|uniref:Uncharacterized protein n=1 Tax=Sandaracinus amylolyticus TaxID=927083 RepID=A0A0F6W8E4_9BACT|nr:hypothetical protein [Sandaracinus amylolyticus]AKF10118.1 hypothetical protein DB32_007267 [Sandaracinus amylolyticus]